MKLINQTPVSTPVSFAISKVNVGCSLKHAWPENAKTNTSESTTEVWKKAKFVSAKWEFRKENKAFPKMNSAEWIHRAVLGTRARPLLESHAAWREDENGNTNLEARSHRNSRDEGSFDGPRSRNRYRPRFEWEKVEERWGGDVLRERRYAEKTSLSASSSVPRDRGR